MTIGPSDGTNASAGTALLTAGAISLNTTVGLTPSTKYHTGNSWRSRRWKMDSWHSGHWKTSNWRRKHGSHHDCDDTWSKHNIDVGWNSSHWETSGWCRQDECHPGRHKKTCRDGRRQDSVYIGPEQDIKRLPCRRSSSACSGPGPLGVLGRGGGRRELGRKRSGGGEPCSPVSLGSTCLIPMNKLSTGNADTMSAVVKLAEKVDESASHVR